MRTRNLEDAKKHHKTHYANNREEVIRKNCERKKELRQWLAAYKSTLSCSKCGENHPACLDFHHTDSSEKEILVSSAVMRGWSKDRILNEISKCIVLCSNCHRKHHYDLLKEETI